MNQNFVQYNCKDRIGYITLNRPSKQNALNQVFVKELIETFKLAQADDSCKVIVLQSNAEVFCAGADLSYLKDLQNFSYEENLVDSELLMTLFNLVYQLEKVVIASVKGAAIAGGCGLATVCDFVITHEDCKFGYTEVKIGFVPALVSVFLTRQIGSKKAKELLLSGTIFSGQKAFEMGLVNKITTKDNVNNCVLELAQQIITNSSSNSLKVTKQLLADIENKTLEDGLEHAAKVNASTRSSKDCKKGINAFLEKIKITW